MPFTTFTECILAGADRALLESIATLRGDVNALMDKAIERVEQE